MIVQRKWTIARSSVGTSAPDPLSDPDRVEIASSIARDSLPESTPAKSERLRSILQTWVTSDHVNRDDTLVATVSAPRSGFIAAIASNDRPQLLVELGDEVSTGLDEQIVACLSASSDEIPTDAAESERALRALHAWIARERASAAAGVGASSTVRRRQITSRIDLAIQSAPPHLRATRSVTAARARRVATTQQCAAVELELDALSHSNLPADEWLEAIAALETNSSESTPIDPSGGSVRIQALLLMRAP
jgi:hypothetical protein